MKVWLDDEQKSRQSWFPLEEGWIATRWPEETIELLKTGKVQHLSLDHDLGEYHSSHINPRTGYDVMLWMEEQANINPEFRPPERVSFHTQNPVGRDKMKASLRSIYKVIWTREGDPRAEGL